MLLSLIGWLFLYHVICGSGIPDAGQVKLTVLSLTVSGVSTRPGWSTFGGTVVRRKKFHISNILRKYFLQNSFKI